MVPANDSLDVGLLIFWFNVPLSLARLKPRIGWRCFWNSKQDQIPELDGKASSLFIGTIWKVFDMTFTFSQLNDFSIFFIKSQRWTSPRLGMPELSISVAKLSCDLRFLEPFVPIYVVWRPEKVLSLLVPIYCMFPHIQIGTPLYLFTFVHRSTPHTHTYTCTHTHIYTYVYIHIYRFVRTHTAFFAHPHTHICNMYVYMYIHTYTHTYTINHYNTIYIYLHVQMIYTHFP